MDWAFAVIPLLYILAGYVTVAFFVPRIIAQVLAARDSLTEKDRQTNQGGSDGHVSLIPSASGAAQVSLSSKSTVNRAASSSGGSAAGGGDMVPDGRYSDDAHFRPRAGSKTLPPSVVSAISLTSSPGSITLDGLPLSSSSLSPSALFPSSGESGGGGQPGVTKTGQGAGSMAAAELHVAGSNAPGARPPPAPSSSSVSSSSSLPSGSSLPSAAATSSSPSFSSTVLGLSGSSSSPSPSSDAGPGNGSGSGSGSRTGSGSGSGSTLLGSSPLSSSSPVTTPPTSSTPSSSSGGGSGSGSGGGGGGGGAGGGGGGGRRGIDSTSTGTHSSSGSSGSGSTSPGVSSGSATSSSAFSLTLDVSGSSRESSKVNRGQLTSSLLLPKSKAGGTSGTAADDGMEPSAPPSSPRGESSQATLSTPVIPVSIGAKSSVEHIARPRSGSYSLRRQSSSASLRLKSGVVLNKLHSDRGMILEHVESGVIDFDRGSKLVRLIWDRTPQTVLLIKKWREPTITETLAEIAEWLEGQGMRVLVEPEVARTELPHLKGFDPARKNELASFVDFCIVLGGDGTLLHLISLLPTHIPPVMSFSFGSMGFLTPFAADAYKESIAATIQGDFEITLRMRIRCRVANQDDMENAIVEHTVLNDVSIDRGPTTFLSNLDVFCDGEYITTVQADGLIVATSTGSTAYSLGAGGSIVHPSMACILLTPICPHSLSFRPIIFPNSATIIVRVNPDARNTAWVSFDGRNNYELKKNQVVICELSSWPVPTIANTSPTRDWILALGKCLYWNKRVQQKAFNSTKTVKNGALSSKDASPQQKFRASPVPTSDVMSSASLPEVSSPQGSTVPDSSWGTEAVRRAIEQEGTMFTSEGDTSDSGSDEFQG